MLASNPSIVGADLIDEVQREGKDVTLQSMMRRTIVF